MMWIIAAIIVCVLMEGLFSGAEIGFYSVNRLRLRSRVEAKLRRSAVLRKLVDRPDTTMMTTLIGTNVMVYAASALATGLFSGSRSPELLATLVMTPVIFVFGEMIPKDIFHRRADSLMYFLAGPIDALRFLVWPVTAVLRGLVWLVTGGKSAEQSGAAFSRAALVEWIAEGKREGVLTDYQHALSANVMGLMKKRVSSAMIPMGEATVLSADLAGEELRDAVKHAGRSRLPVVSGPEMSIVGVLHTLDYIRAAEKNLPLGDLVRRAVEVKHTDGITSVLVALQRARGQMAIVLDDAGRPAGVVTVKDLVEEIVGELQDF
ncbi:MAG: CNNM domain-containing protein [Planctomycetota bacterium]